MSGWSFTPPSWSSGSVITDNSSASLDVTSTNLLLNQHSRRWRSAALSVGGAPLRLTLDAGEARAFDTAWLLFHNGTAAGTLRATGNASTGTLFSAPSVSKTMSSLRFTGDLAPFKSYHMWVNFDAVQTFRYVGIEISDPTNAAGYFEAGVLIVGKRFEPRIGADIDSGFGRTPRSTPQKMLNGENLARSKRGDDEGLWEFPKQGYDDLIQWDNLNLIYGSDRPGVVKWDPNPRTPRDEQRTIKYGYLQWRSIAFRYATAHPTTWNTEVGLLGV